MVLESVVRPMRKSPEPQCLASDVAAACESFVSPMSETLPSYLAKASAAAAETVLRLLRARCPLCFARALAAPVGKLFQAAQREKAAVPRHFRNYFIGERSQAVEIQISLVLCQGFSGRFRKCDQSIEMERFFEHGQPFGRISGKVLQSSEIKSPSFVLGQRRGCIG